MLDVPSLKFVARMTESAESINAACFSEDRKRLVTGGSTGTVQIWDAETGTDLGIIGKLRYAVLAVSFINGGRSLAASDEYGNVRVWLTEREKL